MYIWEETRCVSCCWPSGCGGCPLIEGYGYHECDRCGEIANYNDGPDLCEDCLFEQFKKNHQIPDVQIIDGEECESDDPDQLTDEQIILWKKYLHECEIKEREI